MQPSIAIKKIADSVPDYFFIWQINVLKIYISLVRTEISPVSCNSYSWTDAITFFAEKIMFLRLCFRMALECVETGVYYHVASIKSIHVISYSISNFLCENDTIIQECYKIIIYDLSNLSILWDKNIKSYKLTNLFWNWVLRNRPFSLSNIILSFQIWITII